MEWLAKLGPAEDPRAARRAGRYCYYPKGLTPPLLADEAQRRAYRVTKPWPPERI